MCLEKEKNETVGLYHIFLSQEISRDKYDKNDNRYNNINTRQINKWNIRSNRI